CARRSLYYDYDGGYFDYW
nr:immunoglobulin heavy chain junction region [Mus musculus]